MVFSVAQSPNPKFQKKIQISKTIGRPKNFWKFWISMCFLDFQQKSKKTHGHFWIFSRNPKKHMDIFGFSAEIQKNTWTFLDFQQKSKKHMDIFGFSAEIQKTHGHFWIFSRNPKETHGNPKIPKKSKISEKNPKIFSKKSKILKKSKISRTIWRPKNFWKF